ncbi:MAG TPA: hypothetical protein VEC11_06705 [Allosphingosinicella sp.]|nr:hypothetical protein [Allosphingosinicella sp.]
MTRRLRLLLIPLLVGAPALALAQRSGDSPPPRPESFEALVRCRAITEDAARLACFDRAVAALQAAQERRDVVMVDRQQVREGRRRLFGLALPRIPIFGGGDDDERDEDQVDTVEGVVASASQDGLGHWVVALQDGAVWMQVDNNTLALRPRAGQRVVINRGALGSFMMRVNNQPGIRVRRSR